MTKRLKFTTAIIHGYTMYDTMYVIHPELNSSSQMPNSQHQILEAQFNPGGMNLREPPEGLVMSQDRRQFGLNALTHKIIESNKMNAQ